MSQNYKTYQQQLESYAQKVMANAPATDLENNMTIQQILNYAEDLNRYVKLIDFLRKMDSRFVSASDPWALVRLSHYLGGKL